MPVHSANFLKYPTCVPWCKYMLDLFPLSDPARSTRTSFDLDLLPAHRPAIVATSAAEAKGGNSVPPARCSKLTVRTVWLRDEMSFFVVWAVVRCGRPRLISAAACSTESVVCEEFVWCSADILVVGRCACCWTCYETVRRRLRTFART